MGLLFKVYVLASKFSSFSFFLTLCCSTLHVYHAHFTPQLRHLQKVYTCLRTMIYRAYKSDTYKSFLSDTRMGWLWLVGSLELQVSFAEYSLFYRVLLQKRPIISSSLLVIATSYRPRSFLEAGFRPLCPPVVYFIPLSRTKPAFWISTRFAPGPISQVLPGCRVRHLQYSRKLSVQSVDL